MKIRELMVYLEDNGFKIGNMKNTDYYKENMDNEVKVGLYSRRSKKDKKSIDNQSSTLKRFVVEKVQIMNDAFIEYIDNGFSGTMTKRPQYQQMLSDVKSGKINVIVTTHIDRFGRSIEEVINHLYGGKKINIIYVSLSNKLINAPSNTNMVKEECINADRYAATSSLKIREGLKNSMENGSVINSKPLYGYEIYNDVEFGIRKFRFGDYIKVQTVKEIFDLYLTGKTMNEISKIMTDRQIPTPSGKAIWGKSTIESILKNPLYTGELLQSRYEKLGYNYSEEGSQIKKTDKNDWIHGGTFDAIVDKNVFNTVQNMIEENKSVKTTSNNKNKFTRILKCGDCGRALIYKERAKGYKCSGSEKKGYCTTHLIKEDELIELIMPKIANKIIKNKVEIDKYITNKVRTEILSTYSITKINKIQREVQNAVSELADIYMQRSQIKYSDRIISEIESKIEKLENEQKIVECEMETRKELEDKMLIILDNILESIKAENWIIKLFIKKIVVYQVGKIEIEWRC